MKKTLVAFLITLVIINVLSTVAFANVANTTIEQNTISSTENVGDIVVIKGKEYIITPDGSREPVLSEEYIERKEKNLDMFKVHSESITNNASRFEQALTRAKVISIVTNIVTIVAVLLVAFLLFKMLKSLTNSDKKKPETVSSKETVKKLAKN